MTLCKFCKKLLGIKECDNCVFNSALSKVIERFIKEDKYLTEIDVNERTQTHKLAEYLQIILPEYNVDCEYNKNLTEVKELDFTAIVNAIKNFLVQPNEQIKKDDVYDIIKQLQEELETASIVSTEDGNGAEYEQSGALLITSLTEPNKKYIRKVFPDIIAHLRGTHTNKIVIETKKESNNNEVARLYDRIKLGLFTQSNGQFDYDVGYFIDLPSGIIPDKFEIVFERDKIVSDSNVFIVRVQKLATGGANVKNK